MKKYVFAGIAILGIALGSLGAMNPAYAHYYPYEGGSPSQGNGN